LPRFGAANQLSISDIPSYSEIKQKVENARKEEGKMMPSFGDNNHFFNGANKNSVEKKEVYQSLSPKSYKNKI
jgi:hypothetical protein